MTKLEYIQSCSKEELVRFLCDMHDDIPNFDCGLCVAHKYCGEKIGNGFEKWLEEDINE